MPRYIDADAFIQFVETNESIIKVGSRNGKSFHTGRAVERYYIFDLLRNAPTISPDEARGVGEWEDAKQHGLCRCSVCKDCYIERDYITQAKWKYCPSCGARMKGASENA